MRILAVGLLLVVAPSPFFNAEAQEATRSDPVQMILKRDQSQNSPRYGITHCVDIGSGVSECWDCIVGPNANICGVPYITSIVPKG